jgi:putative transposase
MPRRQVVIANEEIYHVYNRGVAREAIFTTPLDYKRFLNLLRFYRYTNSPFSYSHFRCLDTEKRVAVQKNLEISPLMVEIYAYCLMPNHFHILLKQLQDNGINKFLSRVQNGYAKYINKKYNRVGPLFQSRFKAVRVENDSVFSHVSRYIHLNPCTSCLVKAEKLSDYRWSSFVFYAGVEEGNLVNTKNLLKAFGGMEKYRDFVMDQASYQRKLSAIKHLTLEK